MKRGLLAGVVLFLSACAHGPALFRSGPAANTAADSLYWRAISNLDSTNKQGSMEAAAANLNLYLASTGILQHRAEAAVLRRLVQDARQLALVEAALQQARTATAETRDSDSKARNDEAVKEIQRLKDELAKANEELERIRKRLAAPKP